MPTDTERLEWLIRDYRGVDLYNALYPHIRVCTRDMEEIRRGIDKMIERDASQTRESL